MVEPPLALRPAWNDRKIDTRSMAGIDEEMVVVAAGDLLSRAEAA